MKLYLAKFSSRADALEHIVSRFGRMLIIHHVKRDPFERISFAPRSAAIALNYWRTIN